jgi:hypothetical protein
MVGALTPWILDRRRHYGCGFNAREWGLRREGFEAEAEVAKKRSDI